MNGKKQKNNVSIITVTVGMLVPCLNPIEIFLSMSFRRNGFAQRTLADEETEPCNYCYLVSFNFT